MLLNMRQEPLSLISSKSPGRRILLQPAPFNASNFISPWKGKGPLSFRKLLFNMKGAWLVGYVSLGISFLYPVPQPYGRTTLSHHCTDVPFQSAPARWVILVRGRVRWCQGGNPPLKLLPAPITLECFLSSPATTGGFMNSFNSSAQTKTILPPSL